MGTSGVIEIILHKHADPMNRMTSVKITNFRLLDSSGCFIIHFRFECKEFSRALLTDALINYCPGSVTVTFPTCVTVISRRPKPLTLMFPS